MGISALIIRKDRNFHEKLNGINENLRSLCTSQGYCFIDNANINSSALNSSKFHLKHIDEIRIMLSNQIFDIFAINESTIEPFIPDSQIVVMWLQNY